MNTRPLNPKPDYYDAFIDGQKLLLVAIDNRHRELWRRNDPDAKAALAAIERNGKTVFKHFGI